MKYLEERFQEIKYQKSRYNWDKADRAKADALHFIIGMVEVMAEKPDPEFITKKVLELNKVFKNYQED
tara:strand:- start:374 stop:577 length:204 start_codon:yes stop_codon:yes gene_type:complete